MNYSALKRYSIGNGEGVRTSLYVSGCNFHCKGCFNPETWDFNYGNPYTKETEEEILKLVSSDRVNGLSLLGGDPLWQSVEDMRLLISLVDNVKQLNKTVWIWSAFTWEELFEKKQESELWQTRWELIKACDIWVDGRFILSERNLKLQWCGSNNQRVLDVKQSLEANSPVKYTSTFTK
jgi:anaerobic ribonucleoside-triphosphate reductase activating protein